jgi:glycosyltransferase involved in cell wall biosynthesis
MPAAGVSVVIANYNMARFVGQAVESVLAQRHPPVEVIVVDDGSSDTSAQVIEELAARDPRVSLVRQTNQGQTKAKNAGVRRARGEFVAFCDADDYWLPHKLELQLPRFADPKVAVVYSRSQWIDTQMRLLEVVPFDWQWHEGQVLPWLFIDNFIPFGTAVVRRSVLEEVGGFDETYRMGIDWELWLRIAARYRFAFVDQVTYMYRVWDGQMSRNTDARFAAAFTIMNDFLARFPGLLPASVVRKGYAVTYANRAIWRAQAGMSMLQIGRDLASAICTAPAVSYSWKSVVHAFRAALKTRSQTRPRTA